MNSKYNEARKNDTFFNRTITLTQTVLEGAGFALVFFGTIALFACL